MNFKGFLCCFFVIVIISSVYTQTELYEGDKCTTKDNEPGIFKNIDNCEKYFIMMRDKHGGNLLNQLVYGQGNTKEKPICCRNDPHLKPHLRSKQACQKYQRLRSNFPEGLKRCLGNNIMGGNDSDINEFPYMVAIGYDKENSSTYDFKCAGSLISEKYVITAEHCVNMRSDVPRIVRLGKTSLNNANSNDCYEANDINIIFDVEKLYGKYDPRIKHHDIALLELEKSVEQFYGRNIIPVCLHYGFELMSNLTVIGWGHTNNHKMHSVWLQKAENLKEITLDDCKQQFNETTANIVKTQICITSPENADSCQGDSGGPLLYKIGEKHYLAGIVSYGNLCGGSFPGIYTRVSSYIDWIEDIVWPQKLIY